MLSQARFPASGRGLVALLFCTIIGVASADDDGPEGHPSVRFITELNTAELTIDAESLGAWLKPIIEATKARFPLMKGRKAIVVQLTLRRDGSAVVELAGSPALSEEDIKALEAAADVEKSPRAKVASCTLRVVVKDEPGNPDDLPELTPALATPRERLLQKVKEAPTREGLDLIRRWAIEEALPLLAASASKAEEGFVGVRNLGAALNKALADPKGDPDVEALATKNPDFWRAAVEMKRGNPLAPAVEASLLLADGRIEWAQQVAALGGIFDENKSGNSDLLGFGKTLAEAYLEGVYARIREGITLYDAGKLDEALAAFDAILKDDPQSAWALYERFHTERTMRLKGQDVGDRGEADPWPAVRARILASNPMYQTMGEAHGQEGFFDFARRAELGSLFKGGRVTPKDVVAYADIALDLEAFDMAGLLYWSILTSIAPKDYGNRPVLESFLYALERLGAKEIKENFKGDHAAAFAAIEADRRKRVEAMSKPAARDGDGPEPEPKP